MKIKIEEFLSLSDLVPVIDVRSPSEYVQGHIPGAINIPLFDDSERAGVGIKYKNEGRLPAILAGLEYAGPSLSRKLELALVSAKAKKLLVYCWRGGMRSESMSWLFSIGGIETKVLDGGYKSFRNHILEKISGKRKMIVLGGMTGSSKTHILKRLRESGQQVIDLEELACHKGSAFGSLGQPPQPTTEHFSNLLYGQLKLMDENLPVWVEDESRNIGTVFMPSGFYQNMQETPAIVLMMDVKTRMPRLLDEYSGYSAEMLKASVTRISKRLGGDNAKKAIDAIDSGNISDAVLIVLGYYDKTYNYGLRKKNPANITYVNTDTDDIGINAERILSAARQISW